jgi:hypothetical protein
VADLRSFRPAANLLIAGIVFSFVVGMLHPDRQPPNNHPAVFAEYAASGIWTAVHLGQFVGMAVVVAGLVALFSALNLHAGRAAWVNRFAVDSAVVALALYGVLQAVDGVALKQAVNAWAAAPEAEKVARFASAEAVRWIEWGVRSYQSLVLGVSFVLFAAVIIWTAAIPRSIGYLMGLAGLAYWVQSWVLGSEGFSLRNSLATLVGVGSILAASIWLLVAAWWTKADA